MARLGVLDRPSKSRSASEDRAREVLMSAADLFYRNGFDATSMNDIAKAVKLTKAGLYYYTEGKDDLLYKIINFAMDYVERDILAPAIEIDDPETRLKFIIEAHLKSIFITGGAITILTEQVNKLPNSQRQEIVLRKREYLDIARKSLQQLKQKNKTAVVGCHDRSPPTFFSTIVGVARWYDPRGRFDKQRVANETCQFIMSGLLKDRK